ncbi:MAG: HesA/MoeB/ThiF family protein, partial [Leptospiraceae bacterium]|nr:HesA/MoeB/ThiF family protein [Leptospiraceae bacterium]
MLSSPEITRYSRNILLKGVGKKGQEKLKSSRVGVIGAGGLGSPVLYYLTAVGVGEIRVIDSDTVDLTNLQRQILFQTDSIGKSKSIAAKENLEKLNPEIKIITYNERLNSKNIKDIFGGVDLLIEGSDNFPTKFLVNDFSYFEKIPLIVAGILGFEGQIMGVIPDETFCYRCVFHSPPPQDEVPSCSEAGVIGAVAGVMGSLQANEAVKFLLGFQNSIFGNLLSVDLMDLQFRKVHLKKNKKCKLCGEKKEIITLQDIKTDLEFC